MATFAVTEKPAQKRKAESPLADSDVENSAPATKESSNSKGTKEKHLSASKISSLNAKELTALSHADLVAHVISLQKQLAATPTTKELTPQEVANKVDNLRILVERQIRKSMTWKPSCKTGSATFSQDFIVPSEQIIKALFKRVVKEGTKSWKMKKFTLDDFERAVGSQIEASVRYCDLVITSDVTVRYDAENGTMKCSGKYGKPGTGKAALAAADDEE